MIRLGDSMGNIKRSQRGQRMSNPSIELVDEVDIALLFDVDSREYALALVEHGLVTSQHLLACALKAMPVADIHRMLKANELQPSMLLGFHDPTTED
jgi:hypothetical protein